MIGQVQLEQRLYRQVDRAAYGSHLQAAQSFVDAYKPFAAAVVSSTGGRPLMIEPAATQLVTQIAAAYAAKSLVGTATTMATGLVAFWQMQTWSGGVGPGQTMVPGHAATRDALVALFTQGTQYGDPRHHAAGWADVCAVGVRQVVTVEYPPCGPPQIGPVI